MNSKLILLVVLISCLLSACSMIPNTDNRTWESISCSGFQGWNVCMDHVMKTCVKGFDVRYQQENLVTQERSISFACK